MQHFVQRASLSQISSVSEHKLGESCSAATAEPTQHRTGCTKPQPLLKGYSFQHPPPTPIDQITLETKNLNTCNVASLQNIFLVTPATLILAWTTSKGNHANSVPLLLRLKGSLVASQRKCPSEEWCNMSTRCDRFLSNKNLQESECNPRQHHGTDTVRFTI